MLRLVYALVGIAAAIVVTLVLMHGIRADLPQVYDIDEWDFVSLVIGMLRHHDPNPHWFGHPGTTLLYLMALAWGLMFAIGHVLGVYSNVQAFEIAFLQNVSPFYEAARLVVAAFSLATLGLTFALGRRIFGPFVAVLATAILAFSPLFITYSAVIRTDVVMTAFVLASAFASLNVMARSSWQASIAAGTFAALAFDTKYPAVIVLGTVLLAHAWSARATRVRRFSASLSAFFITSFVGSPFMYLDFRQVLTNLTFERRAAELGGTGEGFFRNLAWYVHDPLTYGLGLPVLLAAVFGIVLAFRGPRMYRLLLPYPLLTLLFISALSLRWDRWAVTLLPWGAIFAAFAIEWAVLAIARGKFVRTAATGAVLLVAFAPISVKTRAVIVAWDAVDPRTVAKGWIEKHLPPGSAIFVENYAVELDNDRFWFYAISSSGRLHVVDESAKHHRTYLPFFGGTLAQIDSEGSLGHAGIQYVVADDWILHAYNETPVFAGMAHREQRALGRLALVKDWQCNVADKPGVALYRVR